MAKKIKFESFKYRFLIAANNFNCSHESHDCPRWADFIGAINYSYENGAINIYWDIACPGNLVLQLNEPKFYLRGDNQKDVEKQIKNGFLLTRDPIKFKNDLYFKEIVMRVAKSAGYSVGDSAKQVEDLRIQTEREFHNAWAESTDVEEIDIRASNEVCTAPEMRHITKKLGDIKGKSLLDVGCGLGEASVYFATLGADVTSTDLSQGMLDATSRLASVNGVSVKQHLASAEDLQLSSDDKFEIIYAGNLLHHVEIDKTLSLLKQHLAPGGVLITWDPLAYNPAINAYRSLATDVRTPDEHPLRYQDINCFYRHFDTVETKYFWFTTLIIFVIMALAQRRNPNKERFWKVVVKEGDKWKWLYYPLSIVDRILLTLLPPLRLLCWNVVLFSSNPK